MVATLAEAAPAKINLSLRVLGRRADGYHALESLVAFADLSDALTLSPADRTTLDVRGEFAAACGPLAGNLVLKAARAAGLPAGQFTLDKRIPVAGGLGGGSADAAAALRLIARRNWLPINDARIVAAARAIGADVPVCLEPRPKMMRGAGEDLSLPLALPSLPAVLVNPGVPLATKDVFAGFAATDRGDASGEAPTERQALLAWLKAERNDLTQAAVARVPAIVDVLTALEALPGCSLARMSGSGATCFGIFATAAEAAEAAKRLAQAHRNWWICAVTIGAGLVTPA